MSDKRFRVRFEQEDGRGEIVNEKGVELTAREVVDLLNEQEDKITELEIELTDCKNRKEQSEYKNTKLISKIDFLERVIDGDV